MIYWKKQKNKKQKTKKDIITAKQVKKESTVITLHTTYNEVN